MGPPPGCGRSGAPETSASPLGAYRWARTAGRVRWAHTDAALTAQLELEREGHPGTVEPGHAAVRFTDPRTGRDALRTEMHRIAPGTATAATRVVGSAVWQVFDGTGTVHIGDRRFDVAKGDLFAVPSWAGLWLETDGGLDAVRFSDDLVYEALGLDRRETE